MFNHLKNWWQIRRAKHYLKSHWHLIIDILLLLVVILLVVNIVVIKNKKYPVDTTPVNHLVIEDVSTSTEYLMIKTDLENNNFRSGEPFLLVLNIKNNSDQEVSDINIKPMFDNNNFVISKLKAELVNKKVVISDNDVIIDKLNPGESVEQQISLVINAKNQSSKSVKISFKSNYSVNGKNFSSKITSSTLKMVSELKVSADAYYHSRLGDQLGSGPVPPVTGLPTNYWIFFEADTKANDFSNITVNAKLPEGVTITNGKTLSAGELNYNESQRRITWSIKKTSDAIDKYQAGFELQIIPTEKQIGTNPLLLTNISYLAIDSYTGESLSGKLSNVDTSLKNDAINKDQGKVLE
jgi:hypothetical protein